MPDEFIPVAQQTGLMRPLTLYVIDEALRQCRAWCEDLLARLRDRSRAATAIRPLRAA